MAVEFRAGDQRQAAFGLVREALAGGGEIGGRDQVGALAIAAQLCKGCILSRPEGECPPAKQQCEHGDGSCDGHARQRRELAIQKPHG